MCPFCTDLEETGKHCLWSFDFAMKIWKIIITLLIPIYPQAVYTWGAVLWAVVQDEPMVYEQDDVTYVIAMIHGLILTYYPFFGVIFFSVLNIHLSFKAFALHNLFNI